MRAQSLCWRRTAVSYIHIHVKGGEPLADAKTPLFPTPARRAGKFYGSSFVVCGELAALRNGRPAAGGRLPQQGARGRSGGREEDAAGGRRLHPAGEDPERVDAAAHRSLGHREAAERPRHRGGAADGGAQVREGQGGGAAQRQGRQGRLGAACPRCRSPCAMARLALTRWPAALRRRAAVPLGRWGEGLRHAHQPPAFEPPGSTPLDLARERREALGAGAAEEGEEGREKQAAGRTRRPRPTRLSPRGAAQQPALVPRARALGPALSTAPGPSATDLPALLFTFAPQPTDPPAPALLLHLPRRKVDRIIEWLQNGVMAG